MKEFNVSIVVSTSDSAIAVAETLESILAQTSSNWEVIVVDDGSDPGTAAIVTSYTAKEPRIRLVNQSYPEICASRNAGIDQANFDWLLFIDAGDWILPSYLERLTAQFSENPQLDVIYCGWVRVTADRKPYGLPECCTASGDLFELLAESNPFAIHGCIVRRSLVEAVGKFDPIRQTHEDWDLWQRIARTGAYFGGTDEVLALDQIGMRSKTAPQSQRSTILDRFTDAMSVLAQGHRADPRVSNPHPDHAQGKSVDRLPAAELSLICTYAGLAIGSEEDARPILAHLREAYDLAALSMDLMKPFLYALPLPTCHPLDKYHSLWERLEQPIHELALAFEKCFRLPAFARRARLNMERAILEQAVASRPVTVGAIYAVQIELTQSIPDISAPSSTERLHCTVELEGERLGFLELPILDGRVASRVLADAIAAEFSEVILKRASKHQFHAIDESLNLEKANLESSTTGDSERFQLPILMYHHVAPTGSSKFSRWRVTSEAFEAQLHCLREAGAYSITLEQWRTAILTQTPLPGRPVLITFDDGYLDFAIYAFPLLKRYGFSATVFVVTDFVGKTNRWDRIFEYGEELPILNWEQIKQLHAEGIEFGSHTLSHPPLTSLSPSEVVREATRSREMMEHELGIPITTFAYPYGDFDPVVQRLIGQCGYEVAVSCRPGYSHFQDPLLQLSRIEISGTDSIQDFEHKLFPLLQGVAVSAVPSGR